MRLRRYTEDQLRKASASSTSIRQVLKKLGVEAYGGNYDVFRKAVKHFGIDTSHFTGQGHRKGKKFQPKRKLSAYLSNKFPIGTMRLKSRLLSEGVLEAKCKVCGLSEWMGVPAPLVLDHIDGNKHDNRLKNLRILCPNCDAQSPTFKGRNRRKA